MKLVAAVKCDRTLTSKLEVFKTKTGKDINFLSKLNNKSSGVEVHDLVYYEKPEGISNICYFRGNKDNRLINLEITNLNSSQVKTNQSFIKAATEYAFTVLNAETVAIISNECSEDYLVSIGYESLGKHQGFNTYVKDKEEQLDLKVATK